MKKKKKEKKKIDPEQQAFINALKANPKDRATHLVYADWLDEHDQPELADLERKWTVAKYEKAWKFMKECLKECKWATGWVDEKGKNHEFKKDSPIKTVEKLIEAATNYLDHDKGIYFSSPECDLDWPRFWESYVTLTSRYVPPERHDEGFFSCSC